MSKRSKRLAKHATGQDDKQTNTADAAGVDEQDSTTNEAGDESTDEDTADEGDGEEEGEDEEDAEGDDESDGDQNKIVDPNSGPTIEEWVAAGYSPTKYPPAGFNSKSTEEEIAAAVRAEADGQSKQSEGDDGAGDAEAVAVPKHGTSAAAEAHLADLPDHPTHPGAKLLDRPLTGGASG